MENGKWELVAWGSLFPSLLSLDGYPRFQGSKVAMAALRACSLMVQEDAVRDGEEKSW